jgi:hypothetical protein
LNDQNGIRVPFFDVDQLARRVIDVLADQNKFLTIRAAARQTILDRYDLTRTCLPALVDFICGDIRDPAADRTGFKLPKAASS